ncbi:MAG: RNA polymerase factor sigma-54 [Sphaerochaetaceae bacterium]|jgi:RNA polymerase sigma-54 factor
MEISAGLSLSQKQQLKLSPQLIQSFELMTLPLQELQARIQTEIETNPALDIPESKEISFDAYANAQLRAENAGKDDDYSDSSSYGSDVFHPDTPSGPVYSPVSDYGAGGGYDEEASDRQQQFIEGALSREETLQEHLMWQLGCSRITDEERRIGELVISGLDENGFHRKDPATLVKQGEQETLKRVLALIQTFDPPGVCAKDFRESLIIQARNDGLEGKDLERFATLVDDYLEQMRAGKTKETAKALGISEEELDTLYRYLKTLTPYPGQLFRSGPDEFVIPDISVHQVDGALQFKLNDDSLPPLRINTEFTELGDALQEQKTVEAKEAAAFIQRSIKDAMNLIGQVQLRNQTLRKVGLALVKYQKEFFLYGPRYLKPLTLKVIADEVSLHETTISRISQAKWIDTDWGIFPIKNLFSNAVSTTEGSTEDLSKNAVKEIIREIIGAHEGPKALSDQKISDMLKERGISVARRTVAKYRGELNIDSSFVRGV